MHGVYYTEIAPISVDRLGGAAFYVEELAALIRERSSIASV